MCDFAEFWDFLIYDGIQPVPWLMWCAVDFKKDGIGVKVVNGADLAAAIDENIKANFVETIGNPRYNVAPILSWRKCCA